MRILITGITGFAGGHLTEALLANQSAELFGLSREGKWPDPLAYLEPRVRLYQADLCDLAGLTEILRATTPDAIYHLAGHADVAQSLRQPDQAWRDNFTATQCLYDAVIRWGGSPRILYVGSGLAYGEPRRPDQTFDEESPFYPVNPYATSKAAADLLSYQYSRFPGLSIIRARPFNHIGPRQSPQYAVGHFSRQIAAIEQGRQEPVVQTGNLAARRDFTDVRDVAHAYIALMTAGLSGEAYNIASGQVHTMEDILGHLLRLAQVRVEVRTQAQLTRAAEPFTTRVSPEKIAQATGWRPTYSLEQSLADTLDYWREHFRQQGADK